MDRKSEATGTRQEAVGNKAEKGKGEKEGT